MLSRRRIIFLLVLLVRTITICIAQSNNDVNFIKALYIDSSKSIVTDVDELTVNYVCNGYNNHWQIFIGDAKNTYLGFDGKNTFSADTLLLNEYNHSGLSGVIVVDGNFRFGHFWKPKTPINAYIEKGLALKPYHQEHVPPFGLTDSIFSFSPKVLIQDKQIRMSNENRIPFDKIVVNPDNILGVNKSLTSIGNMLIDSDCLNPNTKFGCYRKIAWGELYNTKTGCYDFSIFDSIFQNCINNNTRLTLRIDQTHGAWDIFAITKPLNWNRHKHSYTKLLHKLGNWHFSDKDELFINGRLVTGYYPSHVFFEQLLEGTPPCLVEMKNVYRNESCYASFFNYNSAKVYEEWILMEREFRRYIDTKTFTNRFGEEVKAKDLIENLYAAIGITGEGYVRQYGVFPDDVSKYVRYYTSFGQLFSDIPTSFPLAASYDYNKLGDDWLKAIWSIRSDNGRYSGLWYDVIGQKGFTPYTKYSRSAISKLIPTPTQRRWCGESDFSDNLGSQLLTHSYIYHFSGVSQHGLPYKKSQTATEQQLKFITLAGAKLHLSNVEIDGDVLEYELQNIGYCKVFSPFWKVCVIYRNANGHELGRQTLDIDLFDVEPNATNYECVGLYRQHGEKFSEELNIPLNTSTISFAIVDKYGVYENYWLHNKNRVTYSDNDAELKEGEYIIWKNNE